MKIVVAMCDTSRGFGYKNALPWPHLPGDYKFYRELVAPKSPGQKTANIKGRLTWLSSDKGEREQPGIMNIVITTSPKESLITTNLNNVCKSLEEAHQIALNCDIKEDDIWVMGGRGIYEAAIAHPACTHLYLTRIYKDFDVDVTFPPFEHQFKKINDSTVCQEIQEENGIRYQFEVYERIP